DKDTQGGNGGGVGITDGLGEKADCQVTFLNTLSGGAGFSSACQTGTNPPGTKGGDGGTAEIHGAPILENTASGNGGKGGSGTPPSTGGAAGKTDGGVLIGKAGGDGSNCGGTGGTTVTDYNPKHGVAGDSFEISGTHLGGTNAIVTIGGKHATIQFGDDLSIQVTVPSGLSAGTYNLFVNGVLAGSFTIDP
ncbi:MAG TPA: IPT/TIG domain-containing protein, partial [Fimbriimonas sp.]|nr:IPT/TIG domain-containing protein [Fimbriimonas sp.]